MQIDIKKLTVTSPFSTNRNEKRVNEILKSFTTHTHFASSHSTVLLSLYLFHGEHLLIVLLAEVTMAGFFFKLQTLCATTDRNNLTHSGRVTQICVFTIQLCKMDDANLRF